MSVWLERAIAAATVGLFSAVSNFFGQSTGVEQGVKQEHQRIVETGVQPQDGVDRAIMVLVDELQECRTERDEG